MSEVPRKIIVDNGVQFKDNEFRATMKEYAVEVAYIAKYHRHQANAVERIHRVTKTMLAAYMNENNPNLDKYLPKVGKNF